MLSGFRNDAFGESQRGTNLPPCEGLEGWSGRDCDKKKMEEHDTSFTTSLLLMLYDVVGGLPGPRQRTFCKLGVAC